MDTRTGAEAQSELEAMWQAVYEVQSHPAVSNADRVALESIIEQLDQRAPGAGAYLLRGYIHYHFGGLLRLKGSCVEDFKRVLETEPENRTALLYLGHEYFDLGDFEKARHWFGRASAGNSFSACQTWRSLKVRELIASCDLMLHDLDSARTIVSELLDELESSPADACAAPSELIQAIARNAETLADTVSKGVLISWGKRLRTIARRHGVEEAFEDALRAIPGSEKA